MTTTTRSATKARRKPSHAHRARYWSASVTHGSNALDLGRGVFTWRNAKRIALSLKNSAERSKRRKADPYRSALSMLTFYMNRGGRHLTAEREDALARAKIELKRAFGRE